MPVSEYTIDPIPGKTVMQEMRATKKYVINALGKIKVADIEEKDGIVTITKLE